jgi:uncharacterized membrane protein
MEEMQMHPFNLSRRSFLKGTAAMSAAALIAAYPGARLIRAQGSAEYDLIDFGPFEVEVTSGPAAGRGVVNAINEAGMACGAIGVEEARFSPATWSKSGKLKRLKSGKLGGFALDINDDGVVVGHEFESDGELEDRRPVMWQDGEPVELPDLNGDTDGARGSASAINNDGVIAGEVRDGNFSKAVRWIDGVAEALPDAPIGPASTVRGLNDNGTILASVSVEGNSGLVQTFGLWRGDEVTIIEFPEDVTEGYSVFPQALGGQDQVVFIAYNGDFSESFSFTTDGESVTIFDSREDGFGSLGSDLNDAGTVVGATYADESQRAAIWVDGEVADLNDLVAPGSGLTLTWAGSINNVGMIAGSADDEDGIPHGCLLIPAS